MLICLGVLYDRRIPAQLRLFLFRVKWGHEKSNARKMGILNCLDSLQNLGQRIQFPSIT